MDSLDDAGPSNESRIHFKFRIRNPLPRKRKPLANGNPPLFTNISALFWSVFTLDHSREMKRKDKRRKREREREKKISQRMDNDFILWVYEKY